MKLKFEENKYYDASSSRWSLWTRKKWLRHEKIRNFAKIIIEKQLLHHTYESTHIKLPTTMIYTQMTARWTKLWLTARLEAMLKNTEFKKKKWITHTIINYYRQIKNTNHFTIFLVHGGQIQKFRRFHGHVRTVRRFPNENVAVAHRSVQMLRIKWESQTASKKSQNCNTIGKHSRN